MRNNNGTTISERTRITVSLVIAILVGLGGFATVAYKAASALPREEARQIYVPKDQYQKDIADINKKLDQLIQMHMSGG